jgi:4-hydroxy-tetrahydrodipicolinate synthase
MIENRSNSIINEGVTMQIFHGLSAFPITPADDMGIVDAKALSHIINRLVLAKVDSIGLLGSTGIYAYLSREERLRAIQIASAAVQGKVPLIIGVGALRTDAAIQLAQDAAAEGADALLMAPMSYVPVKSEEVYQHFVAVAGATDLPLCIYNNPGTTNFVFDTELLERLAVVPNICAVKMPLPSKGSIAAELTTLRGGPARTFSIGYSGDWGIADAMLAGADGFYSGLGGILPNEVLQLVRTSQTGNEVETHRLNTAFEPLWALFKEFGGLRVIYSIANTLNLCAAKPPLPILPLPADAEGRLDNALSSIDTATR